MKKKYSRRLLREKALQILYAYEYNPEGLERMIAESIEAATTDDDERFFRTLVYKTVAEARMFDEEIEKRVRNWEMSRVALLDRLILRMGMCELIHLPDVPTKVTINEAIEIAKEFSTGSSGKFVNGVLDVAMADFKERGLVKKAGRGLVEESSGKSKSDE
ncbi:MAG: transcription antitermination factor NusB [Ignavibacteriales bacterium]|nr:transcription antitermination factor NusB [Ignavibacteriales bacterium]